MNWVVVSGEEQELFASMAGTIALQGTEINANWMSRLVKVAGAQCSYYVKSYASRGRYLRRFLGRSRLRTEWENLQAFKAMGIPTVDLIAYGESGMRNYQGALVTRELRNTRDLASVAADATCLRDKSWRAHVIRRLSASVRTMHDHGFVHNDLKWRNILVEMGDQPQHYIIDCPQGRKMSGPFLTRGKIKDLACLDKVAKSAISKADRLRFYKQYKYKGNGKARLEEVDKKELRRILCFFDGRE